MGGQGDTLNMPIVKVHDMIASARHERNCCGLVPLLLALWPPQGLDALANQGCIVGASGRRGGGWGHSWGGGSRGGGSGRGSGGDLAARRCRRHRRRCTCLGSSRRCLHPARIASPEAKVPATVHLLDPTAAASNVHTDLLSTFSEP